MIRPRSHARRARPPSAAPHVGVRMCTEKASGNPVPACCGAFGGLLNLSASSVSCSDGSRTQPAGSERVSGVSGAEAGAQKALSPCSDGPAVMAPGAGARVRGENSQKEPPTPALSATQAPPPLH